MQWIRPDINIDFMGRRKVFLVVSCVLVVLSLVSLVWPGPRMGIDFSGGTQIQAAFKRGITMSQVRAALRASGYGNAEVVSFGERERTYLITVQQTTSITPAVERQVRERIRRAFGREGMVEDSFSLSSSGDRLQVQFGADVDVERLEQVVRQAGLEVAPHRDDEVRATTGDGESLEVCDAPVCQLLPLEEHKYEVDLVGIATQVIRGMREELGGPDSVSDPERVIYVGPKVGNQLKWAALKSVLYALGFIMLYIAIRFDLRFAPGGVVALFHDTAITLGVFVLVRHEISLPIIAALLTIIGYSINDTVVVFDRIRENFQKLREREISAVINQSINETLSRTLLTSLTTIITVVAIFILGGGIIRDFALALIVGIAVGTYSSIYIASPLVVLIDRLFYRRQAQG